MSKAESYWRRHTVRAPHFWTRRGSLAYLDWRYWRYPLMREVMPPYGSASGVVLDYGCGPGNDLVGLAEYSTASEIIGVDVSLRALRLARRRLRLHPVAGGGRVRLMQGDGARIPLRDASVDHIWCEGVLHHVSNPIAVLHEFRRVLAPGGSVKLMVYNRNSVWRNLYVPYVLGCGDDLDEACRKSTDGKGCPIARFCSIRDVSEMVGVAGFDCDFMGSYFADVELRACRRHLFAAMRSPRIPPKCRRFLGELTLDVRGYPMDAAGFYAGIGGVYVATAEDCVIRATAVPNRRDESLP